MLKEKELLMLEDFLTHSQSCSKNMNSLAGTLQDAQSKQLLQQIAQKSEQHVQTMSKHLNANAN